MKTKRGFLAVAENNNGVDFVEMAYACALSLKKTQSKYHKMSIMVTDPKTVSKEQSKIFDEVIVYYPDKEFKEYSKSVDTTSLCDKYYECTPYDETMVLDADMLFSTDITEWWNILEDKDLVFTHNVKSFRGNNVHNDFYRKVFSANNLPDIYTGMFYFKKSESTEIYFNLVQDMFKNWVEVFDTLDNKPLFLSADVVYAYAYKLLDLPDYSKYQVPTFVHMKTGLQCTDKIEDDWTKFFDVYVNNNITINNYIQKYPFHYHHKQFLTKDIIETPKIIR